MSRCRKSDEIVHGKLQTEAALVLWCESSVFCPLQVTPSPEPASWTSPRRYQHRFFLHSPQFVYLFWLKFHHITCTHTIKAQDNPLTKIFKIYKTESVLFSNKEAKCHPESFTSLNRKVRICSWLTMFLLPFCIAAYFLRLQQKAGHFPALLQMYCTAWTRVKIQENLVS